MHIKKLKIQNFKKFQLLTHFHFNEGMNIIVGDNESGKSTLLEAIEICLEFTIRGKSLNTTLTTDLFNHDCVEDYLASDKSQSTLPEILIEVYLEGNHFLKGDNNSDNEDTEGIFARICFDSDLADSYAEFIKEPDGVSTLPVEFYKPEWYSFAWDRMTRHNKKINCLFVDPSRLHPSYGRAKYISSIINSALDKSARSALNLNYRQLKARFDQEKDVIAINEKLDADDNVTKKTLKVTADIASSTSWESNLQLTVDDVAFGEIGKGEQNQIQIKLALQNKAEDIDIVMLEEPENHLSYTNLTQLISHIENKNKDKQIFITTHSSFVLNKLSLNNLCLLSTEYARLTDIDPKTVKTLKRLPGYDTLRVVLAQKLILVEGPSDELLIRKLYMKTHNRSPEDDGVDILVVRGIGFKTYLNIVKSIKHTVRVVKDNDGDYTKNIKEWSKEYGDYSFITFYSPRENEQYSLEPALVEANCQSIQELDHLAEVMLSAPTFTKYQVCTDLEVKKRFLKTWFEGGDSGSKKVDSALRILDSDKEIKYPSYLKAAIKFDP